MGDVFGIKVSVADLVVAFIFAVVVERAMRFGPKLLAVGIHYAARWSNRSRAARIAQLKTTLATLESDLTDKHRQTMKAFWYISWLIKNTTIALLASTFAIGLIILRSFIRMGYALNLPSAALLHLEIGRSAWDYFLTIGSFVLILIAAYHFLSMIRIVDTMIHFAHPNESMAELRERIDALESRRGGKKPPTGSSDPPENVPT
jgi:hypothetical protein